MTPEGKVKEFFKVQVMRRYGHMPMWYYSPPGGRFGQAGTGDRVMLIDHVCVMVEMKAEGQVLTPLQAKRLRDFAAAGGVAASLIGKDQVRVNMIFLEIDRRREMWHWAQLHMPKAGSEHHG